MKPIWNSKTLWMNLIIAAAAFFPDAQAWVASHPMVFTEAFVVINVILRLLSKDKLSLGN